MINSTAEKLIKDFEGLRLKAYQCSADVWTIGWGHTKGVKKGDTCSLAQAEQWFIDDYLEAMEGVKSVVKVGLNSNQMGALVSFVFNLGIGNLKRSTMLRELNFHRYERVPFEMAKWVYAGENKLRGLVKRRKAEGELFLTPV